MIFNLIRVKLVDIKSFKAFGRRQTFTFFGEFLILQEENITQNNFRFFNGVF